MNRRRVFAVVITLILVAVVLYSGLRILESTVLLHQPEETEPTTSKTVSMGDIKYFPRQDITVFMVLGIDETGPVRDSQSYNNSGESDVVLLVIFDEPAKTYTVLALNRDSMVKMPILGLGGKKAGTKVAQLALAHTYGSGLADSCENTRQVVSDLLGGVYINYYLSMNMDAVAILNDAVGGVTVNVIDDFSDVDPTIEKGIVTLQGSQALTYVQTRKGVGTQMNISRMERQKQYMNGFVAALHASSDQSSSFALDLYEKITPYIVTDCSANVLSQMADRLSQYELADVITPEGENTYGGMYMEFYLDEEALDKLVLELFYAPK